jgi:UDP-glucose 6-dehydrogenase
MRVIAYDPLASDGAQNAFRDHALVADTLHASLVDASLIIVTTPDDLFKVLKAEDFLGNKKKVTVVDCWRCLDESVRNHPQICYVPLGRCLDDAAAAEVVGGLWSR